MKARYLVAILSFIIGLFFIDQPRLASANEAIVEVRIKKILLDPSSKSPVVVLESLKEHKFIPIWIGKAEATSIALELEHVRVLRPNTHDLIRNIVEGLGAKLHRITITDLRNNTYFATITLKLKDQEFQIDSRPSDAIAVALRMSAPIYAAIGVLAKAGRLPDSLLTPNGARKIFGFHIQNLTEELASFFDLKVKGGVLVAHVELDGAASKAGFQRGDVITNINGKTIHNVGELESLIKGMKRPLRLRMQIRRKGKPETVVLLLPS